MNVVIMYFIILFGRIIEMTFGTVRVIFVINNKKILAAITAGIEILIWVLIVREILNSDTFDLINVLVYSLGYAIGTLIGAYIEKKIAIGSCTLHILIDKDDEFLIKELRDQGYGLAAFDSTQNNIKKLLLILEVDRKKVLKTKKIVSNLVSNAQITVFGTRSVNNGYFSK